MKSQVLDFSLYVQLWADPTRKTILVNYVDQRKQAEWVTGTKQGELRAGEGSLDPSDPPSPSQ